jgi:hypothetical protein
MYLCKSTQHNLPWEADSHSSDHEISGSYGTRPSPSHNFNPLYFLIFHFSKIHFKDIL